MEFTVIFRAGATKTERWRRAHDFILTSISEGHNFRQCFFQEAGVTAAIDHTAMPVWIDLAAQSGAELILCSQAIEEYRVEAPRPFVVGGLGTLIEAGVMSDKVVCFA